MKQTTIRFFGSIVNDFPEIADNAEKLAVGDLIDWTDAGLQVCKSIGNLVCECMHKRDMMQPENELEGAGDLRKNPEQQLEQEMLMKLNQDISRIQDEFKENKATLSRQYRSEYVCFIQEKANIHQKLQQTECDTRKKLHSLLDINNDFLKRIKNDENYSEKVQRRCEETQRVLQNLINKNIII